MPSTDPSPANPPPPVLRLLPVIVGGILLFLGTILPSPGAAPDLDFNRDIRPILSQNCFLCHGPDAAERKGGRKTSGGLRLDTPVGQREDHGGWSAVVPGQPNASKLLERLITNDPDDLMPPPDSGKQLSAEEIARLKSWIEQGAPFSRHWSYEPPRKPSEPAVRLSDWPRQPIDRFLLARLEKEGLAPQPEADRRTLARRAALDLTGLPPSEADLTSFLNDARADAYERFVDRLLTRESYGEHWARLWLDLARYADSAGYADDPPRTIWPYRDYVIRAFNRNLPFDQFTIEQLAGDLLENPTEEQRRATAFHRNTMTNSEGGTSDEEFRNVAVVDRLNTTFAVWMGTSMACAQCHTHKYDPITQHEYFQLFAFLNNTADADRPDEAPLLEFFADDVLNRRRAIDTEFAALEQALDQRRPDFAAAAAAWTRVAPHDLDWTPQRPFMVKAESGARIDRLDDLSLLVHRAATNLTHDLYTVEIPFDSATTLTALRLEALGHESLPGYGPGIAGGFTLRRVKASLMPVPNQAGPDARYVRIESASATSLALGEVAVFSNGDNIAQAGGAQQSSTWENATAASAIDGRLQPSPGTPGYSRTTGQEAPWWELDLRDTHPVERLVLHGAPAGVPSPDGLRILVLDADRRVVWEKSTHPALKPLSITTLELTGPRELTFAIAVASTNSEALDAALVATDSPRATPIHPRLSRPRDRGWSVTAGTADASLVLLPSSPVEIPRGATLRLTLQQQASAENQTLGRFRFSAARDPRAAEYVDTPADVLAALRTPEKARTAPQHETLLRHFVRHLAPALRTERERLAALESERAAMKPLTVPILRELPESERRTTQVHLRGNYQALGDEVQPEVPAAWHPLPAHAPRNRLTFARWLVSRDNPLTARVLVNRYWEHLFGEGIVRTSEEFGSQGDAPEHPALLDWLAVEFMDSGWNQKALLKRLVTSAAYRQSSRVTPSALERDPDNRLLSRGPRFRMSAEMVRDQALAVAGLLSARMYGPSVRPVRPSLDLRAAFGGNLDWQTSDGEDRFRRGLYTEWRRTSPYPSMATFDAPSREVCTLRRNRSNTPLQALVTLNDPVYVEAAQALARRILSAAHDPHQRIQAGFQFVLARPASAAEAEELNRLVDEARERFDASPAQAVALTRGSTDSSEARALDGISAAEFAAWTTAANVLLNLDETLMKR